MNSLVRVLKSIYNFFAGDLILLIAVVVAFGAAGVLGLVRHEENLLLVVILVGVIVIGIVTTIGRELGAAIQQAAKAVHGTETSGTETTGPDRPRETPGG